MFSHSVSYQHSVGVTMWKEEFMQLLQHSLFFFRCKTSQPRLLLKNTLNWFRVKVATVSIRTFQTTVKTVMASANLSGVNFHLLILCLFNYISVTHITERD